tara:strand:- start:7044 stop:7220 length:177 start_codon:yes stop_codon:yes gene_type:complete
MKYKKFSKTPRNMSRQELEDNLKATRLEVLTLKKVIRKIRRFIHGQIFELDSKNKIKI